MSLKPEQQLEALTLTYPTFNTSERGGILSLGTVSGIQIIEYARDPSGVIPIGIQLNDVEHIDPSRQIDPRCLGRRVDYSMAIVGAATDGEFTTDWISITGTLIPGQKAYVGPSGTITNNGDLGGVRIGTFISILEIDPHTVVFAGKGWSRKQMDSLTKTIFIENDPANRTLVITPGYAKVRIGNEYMTGKAG
jgi:hypothetical protein